MISLATGKLARRGLAGLVLVLFAMPFSSAAFAGAGKDGDWITLFDGKSLDAWQSYKDGSAVKAPWVIEDGALCLKRGGAGDIVTKETFDNFELELEWKVTPGANSGVIYKVRPGDPAPYMSGPEYQVLDDSKHADGKNPLTAAGSLYAIQAAKNTKVKPVGEWNSTRIKIQGSHLEHWLNGKLGVHIDMASDDWTSLIAKSKFRQWPQFGKTVKGHIALQDHGDTVYFRNIRIRKLAAH